MQFRVVIPDHVKAGQTIRIHCPDGTEANVKVPKGLKTGDSFIFEMSVDQLKNPQALLNTLKDSGNNKQSTSKGPSGSGGNTKSDAVTDGDGNSTVSGRGSGKRGFLDREIVNVQDFLLALFVGLIIGVGIVLGFILGVLAVTEDTTTSSSIPLPTSNIIMPQQFGGGIGGSGSSTVVPTPVTPDDSSIKEQIRQKQQQQQQQQAAALN